MSLWEAAMGRSVEERVFAAVVGRDLIHRDDPERQPRSNPLRRDNFPEAKRAERRAKNKAARKARKSR